MDEAGRVLDKGEINNVEKNMSLKLQKNQRMENQRGLLERMSKKSKSEGWG